MSSKKFEQLINYVINEDTERAEQLFHEIVVETSRGIYERIMEQEDLDEGMDTDLMQEIESEEQNGMQMDEAEDDMEFTDTEEMDGDMEPMGDDMGDEGEMADMDADAMGGDDMGTEEPATKDDIMDLKDMLDEIIAAFHDDQGEEEAEGEADELAGMEDEAEGEEEEAEGEEEEDSAAMMEAVQLKKVSVTHTDGADGGAKKSTVAANSGKAGMEAKPVKIGEGGEEKGRTAPTAKPAMSGKFQNSAGDSMSDMKAAPKPKHETVKAHSVLPESRKPVKRRI
jgi:hypothetical protein